jgi:hypothetical protein
MIITNCNLILMYFHYNWANLFAHRFLIDDITKFIIHSPIDYIDSKIMTYHLKQWMRCLKHCAMMALLASSPERLPNSVYCILLSLASYLLVGLMLVDEQRSYLTIVGHIALELILLTLITYVTLRIRKTLSRMFQTMSALIGTNLIMTSVSLPLYSFAIGHSISDQPVSQLEINLTIVLIFWNLTVLSLIFKRAFGMGTLISAMICFNYFVLYQLIILWLY